VTQQIELDGLVEYGPTKELFEHPRETHTQDYIAREFS
jgi:ABC-type phosphate transport system ATPase subunit